MPKGGGAGGAIRFSRGACFASSCVSSAHRRSFIVASAVFLHSEVQ